MTSSVISPPHVTGPISIFSTAVNVRGHFTDAVVSIILNEDLDNPIGEKTASWSSEIVTLTNLPIQGLKQGDRISAIQKIRLPNTETGNEVEAIR